MDGMDIFNSISYLEPKCPVCDTVIEYGVNTRWEEDKKQEICLKCGSVLRKEDPVKQLY